MDSAVEVPTIERELLRRRAAVAAEWGRQDAGVLVGAGLGWLIDRGLGTLPWGMFVFALLGFTAGVLNVMRQAGVVSGGVPDSTIERHKD